MQQLSHAESASKAFVNCSSTAQEVLHHGGDDVSKFEKI